MEIHIVRQAIMDASGKLAAYELVYFKDASSLYNQRDARAANAIAAFFSEPGSGSFFGGKDCFLTFTPNLLMKEIPNIFDPKKMVIQIEENILVSPEATEKLLNYWRKGYRIAAIGFDFKRSFLNMLPYLEIIKVDFSANDRNTLDKICALARSFGKKIAAYGLSSPELKELAQSYGCEYYQGESVAEMVGTTLVKPDHQRANFVRLIGAISAEMPDFSEITKMISLDVTLSYSILKLVNSAYFALPNKVKDVKQALNMLGLNQLRQWLFLLSFSDGGGVSDEIIKLSFLRAIFCQELSEHIPLRPVSRGEAYLLGMFSTLGALLEVPLESAVGELPLSDELMGGLLGEEGAYSRLLKLCLSYEKGKWSEVEEFASALGLPESLIKDKYMKAVGYVDTTWSELKGALNN